MLLLMTGIESDSYYLLKDNQESGPFTTAQIHDQVTRGLIGASVRVRMGGSSKWQPLLKALYDPESSLGTRAKIKRLWKKIQLVLTVGAVVLGAIYVLIVNGLSLFEAPDSHVAFLVLAAFWTLCSLRLAVRKTPKRPGEGWVVWTMVIFALGSYACLSHLSDLQYHRTTAIGAVASIVILVFACLEFAKRQREETENERQRDPKFRAKEEELARDLREERKREFLEFAKEFGVRTADRNEHPR